MNGVRTIELLAPAKDYESAVAAVDYGADAVYMGGSRFGARQGACNPVEDVARAVEYAHRYGVRVHATLNTLLWDKELNEAERQARELIAAGVDALIVQDMALRRMDLPVELHASTQVSNRTPEGVRFLSEVGFARVILERGLTLDEIRAICKATTAEVECFVHGAICVGYSGRCFLSRSMSERSGNRGACSQPCRLPYDLTDGRGKSYIAGKHLLSVRDLNYSTHLGELIDAGVSSFKIEGRLKEINYIRNVVAYYRRVLDREIKLRPGLKRSSVGESRHDFFPDTAKSFARGESDYYLHGKHAGVASFNTPKAVGEPIGRVTSVGRSDFRMERVAELAAGDGLCFLTKEGVVGTSVNAVAGDRVLPNRMKGIEVGAEVYRNFDRKFILTLEHSRTKRVIPAKIRVTVAADGVSLQAIDCEGVEASAEIRQPLEKANNVAANEASLRQQAQKSGDTIFGVETVEVVGSEWFVPASVATSLRREALEKLLQARLQRPFSHRILPENQAAVYPQKSLSAEENVTNHLAEAFYRDHGVEKIEQGLDLQPSTVGHRVMSSPYCIRREIGQCLKEQPRLRGKLYLEHGAFRYRLDFDCERCEMNLVDCTETKTR